MVLKLSEVVSKRNNTRPRNSYAREFWIVVKLDFVCLNGPMNP